VITGNIKETITRKYFNAKAQGSKDAKFFNTDAQWLKDTEKSGQKDEKWFEKINPIKTENLLPFT
jgi:hypothetical protein